MPRTDMDQSTGFHRGSRSLTAKQLQKSIREAEGLERQGRLREAELAYKSLIQRVHAWMMQAKEKGRDVGPGGQKMFKRLEDRLVNVQRRIQVYEKEQAPLNLQAFRNRLENAGLYARRGLTTEAETVYTGLIERIRSWNVYNQRKAAFSVRAANIAIRALQDTIASLHATGQPEPPSGPTRPMGVSRNDRIILWLSVAAAGGKDAFEGMAAVLRDQPVEKRLTQPVIELAEAHFRAEEYRLATSVYRALLEKGDVAEEQRTRLLERLGESYEHQGDRRKALQAYLRLLALDRSRDDIVRRVKGLRREVRRIHLRIATVTEHPWFFFSLSVLIALVFMAFIPYTETVNNVDYFTIEHHPEMIFYEEFKEIFGNDEFFVIAFQKEELFTEEGLLFLSDLTRALEDGLENVEEVSSLANVNDIVGEESYFEVREFLEEIPAAPSELARLQELATHNPLYVNNLVSRDGKTAAVVVEALEQKDDEDYRKNLLAKTEGILDSYRDRVPAFHLAGWTETNVRLSEYMKRDVSLFIPLTYLLITLAIWFVFRNLPLTVLAILNITVCVGSVMGLYGLTGIKLNNVTSIIPSMVMALALCDTVHIYSHMDRHILLENGGDRRLALAAVLRLVIVPSFLTTITTAVGFLSQAVSEIPPIRQFAWIASAGMVFEFLYSFFFLPPLLLILKPEGIYRTYQRQKGITRYLSWNFNVVQHHHRLIVVFFGLVIVTAAYFMTNIQVENSAIGCFKKSSPLRQSLDFVQKRLGGVDSLDISLRADQGDAFKDPENLRVIEKIQQYVSTLHGVDQTVSFVDFLKDMNESFHEESSKFYKIPESRAMVSQYLLLYSAEDIEEVVNSTYDHARIAIRISFDKTSQQEKLIAEIREYIAQKIHAEHLDIRVTGRAMENVVTIGSLVDGQLYSLALAAGVVSLIMFLALRSMAMGTLSILPNVFPIVLNFGIMGAMAIPLDTGTAIIASVAIGIAVDDTIHFLSEYRNRRALGMPIPRALNAVLFLKGRALFSSSLILCIGFSVVVFSSFIPTMHFGVLTAIVMLTALVGDTYLLPSVIMLKKKGSA